LLKPIGFFVYRSRLLCDLSPEDLDRLVTTARALNTANDITGFMILEEGYFYHYFEGPGQTCERLMARLKDDPRHTDIKILGSGLRYGRHFGHWSMGVSGRLQLNAATVGACRSAIGRQLKYANGETVIDHLLFLAGRQWDIADAPPAGRIVDMVKSFPTWPRHRQEPINLPFNDRQEREAQA
jgi:hypothetical protein